MALRRTSPSFDAMMMIACLLIAVGLRLALIFGQPDQLTLDRDAYLGIATSLAEGRGYSSPNSASPTAFRPPLYPLCLAIGLRGLPPAVVVGGINLLSGLLTVWVTARIGACLRLGRIRFVAAFLVAIDPLLVQYSSQPMTESLSTLLATLWLWSMLRTWPSNVCQPGLTGLWTGISFGLLVLSRPTFWLIAGFCCLHWIIEWRRITKPTEPARAASSANAICSVAGTILVVAPWVIRNWIVFGIPILMTSHGGYTLLLGNNPVFYDQVVRQSWGTVWPDASQRQWETDLQSQMERDLGAQATELQRDAWQSRHAKSFITSEPWHFAEATVHRIRSLWNTTPRGDAANSANGLVITVVGWYYTIVLLAGFAGMIVVLRSDDRGRWWPLFVLIASIQLVHLAYWTNTRMRAPLTPAIALFAAAVISRNRETKRMTTIWTIL